ncbi:MAG TPA: ComEC/Rec2 family competence protein [Candidatus Xenobia bacterium]|jgi:competence protein ComEC
MLDRPLVGWTLTFLVGCHVGAGWLPDALRVVLFGALWGLAAALRRCPWTPLVLFFCLGCGLSSHASRHLVDPFRDGAVVDVVGLVDEVPRHGLALVHVGSQWIEAYAPQVHWRDVVRCRGKLAPVLSATNPLEPDRRRPGVWHHLASGTVRVEGTDDHGMWGPCLWIRARVEGGITRLWPGPEGLLMRGLLLGDVQRLPPAWQRLFIETGTSHLLAANGLKVAAVAFLVGGVLGFVPLSVRPRLLLTAGLVVAYAGACGASWPVLRATLMLAAMLGAEWCGHEYDGPNALAAAALVLALFDPLAVADPSFVLSFWVMGGLLLIRPPLEGLLDRWPLRWRRAVAMAVAVQAVLLPWQVAADHQVAVGPILANLLVVPPMELIVVVGLPLATVGGSFPAGAALVRLLLTVCLGVLAHVPREVLTLPSPPPPAGELRVTFLDVGQGDGAVVRLPDGQVLLVDAGPQDEAHGHDAGAQVVAPFLLRSGCREVALAVVSHPHLDHYGGLPAVEASEAVKNVVECGLEGTGTEWAAYRHANPRPERWKAGDRFRLAGLTLDVLHPGPVLSPQPNNASLVFKLTWGRVSFLFCGDAEKEAEAEILGRDPAALSATVLKVPHHGSATSSTEAFLTAVHPRVAIVSVGRHNHLHLPNPVTMARLQTMVPLVLRTDRDGGVTMTTDGTRLWIEKTLAGGPSDPP